MLVKKMKIIMKDSQIILSFQQTKGSNANYQMWHSKNLTSVVNGDEGLQIVLINQIVELKPLIFRTKINMR